MQKFVIIVRRLGRFLIKRNYFLSILLFRLITITNVQHLEQCTFYMYLLNTDKARYGILPDCICKLFFRKQPLSTASFPGQSLVEHDALWIMGLLARGSLGVVGLMET